MKDIIKKHFNSTFNPKKQHHSKNVHSLVRALSDDPDVEKAALFHDFIEHGGDERALKKILSPTAVKLVKKLTNNSNTDVLKKLKKELKTSTKKIRDKVIKIKLADRADNFQKRELNKDLSDTYIDKTAQLVNYLYKQFSNPIHIKKFIQQNFLTHNKLKDKIQL